jgi:hypothetical protein
MSNNDTLQKRVADDVCARCRRPILAGHRVQAAFICINPRARNPNKITEKGLELGTDCEFVHVSCEDPYLTGKLANKVAE